MKILKALIIFLMLASSHASAFVVGLNPQAHTGGMDAAGKAFLQELKPHSLRLGAGKEGGMDNINWAAQNGMGVLLGFGYGDECDAKTESGRKCYADRSAKVAQEVGAKAQYFSVWNEWNGRFGPYDINSHWVEYTDLLCKTYKAVKAVRPSARIAGGVIAGSNEDFLRGMLDAGAGDCMDVLDLHLYVYRESWPRHVPHDAAPKVAADRFIEIINERHALVKQKTGKTMPIIVSEMGRHNSGTMTEAANDQATVGFIRELFGRVDEMPSLEGLWWYQLKDAGKDPKRYGNLVRSNDTKMPAFEAFKAAASGGGPPPPDPELSSPGDYRLIQ